VNTSGNHLLAEYWECGAVLDDVEYIEVVLRRAAAVAGARVLRAWFHRFSPQGVSGVLVIQESHLSIHTWPERSYAAVDLYTCGDADVRAAQRYLAEALGSTRSPFVVLARGEGGLPHARGGAVGPKEQS
jgi:S-adenosylmethionine decarboxylase proenzyme